MGIADGAAVVPVTSASNATTTVRSLGRRGIRTIAASDDGTSPASWSRYCDETVELPSPGDDLPSYRDALLSLAARPAVRTILPQREVDAYVLSKYRDAFDDHVATVWPSLDVLATVQDRVDLAAAARAVDVPVPETTSLDEVDDWSTEFVVKARYAVLTTDYDDGVPAGESSQPSDVFFPEPGVEPDRDAIVETLGHVPVAQEYVPGEEYSFRALYDRGEAVATTQLRQHRGFKYYGSASVYRESAHVPELDDLGRALLDHLGWHGVAEVEFRRDARTGTFRCMEVNPRFWGSLPCDVYAGADFPYLFWRLAVDDSLPDAVEYEPDVGSHLLRGELVHLLSVLRDEATYVERPSLGGTLRDVVVSLYEQPRFDNLRLDDPGPFVRDLLDTIDGVR